jgi:hypothetical protein
VTATEAHTRFCISLRDEFTDYSAHLWGLLPPIRRRGIRLGVVLRGWGDWTAALFRAPLADRCHSCSTIACSCLRTIRECYPKAWGRYGLVDAFNPLTGWYNPDVLGIDLGITMLMAENARSGFVWDTFMNCRHCETTV